MNNKGLRTTVKIFAAALVLAIVVCFAGVQKAAAQCCPTYTVVVNPSVPLSCFPLSVTTTWSNGTAGTTAHAGPGAVTLAAPNPPGCWLAPVLGVFVNGIPVPLPCGAVTLPCGYTATVCVTPPGGCTIITIN